MCFLYLANPFCILQNNTTLCFPAVVYGLYALLFFFSDTQNPEISGFQCIHVPECTDCKKRVKKIALFSKRRQGNPLLKLFHIKEIFSFLIFSKLVEKQQDTLLFFINGSILNDSILNVLSF